MSTARIRRSAIVLASLLVSAVPAVAAEPLPPPLIQDTPLVLKDGRMAYVTVRAVPFERGADTLSPSVAEGVAAAAAEIATDCFLTAQAIGHVEPGAQGEGDMLASHRLARARAERVQEALSLHGIPASAIASVWDWQFLVREPRVTLWVFRMRRGEDCQGKPLPGNTSLPLLAKAETPATPPAAPEQPPQEAASTPPAPQPAPAPEQVAAVPPPAQPPPAPPAAEAVPAAAGPTPLTAAAPPEGTSSTVRLQGPVAKLPIPPRPAPAVLADAPPAAAPTPPATVLEPALPAPLASAEPDPAPVTKLPAAPPKAAMAALPPLTMAPTSALAETPPAAPAPPPVRTSAKPKPTPGPAVAALEPEPEQEAASATEPGIELVFDNNSSYLPDGASKQLKRWIASLPKARGYRIELAAAVGTADAKTTDPKQAARYGRWLAERRLGRISEWLEKNVEVRDLQLQQKFLENDSSRRVVVRASPVT